MYESHTNHALDGSASRVGVIGLASSAREAAVVVAGAATSAPLAATLGTTWAFCLALLVPTTQPLVCWELAPECHIKRADCTDWAFFLFHIARECNMGNGGLLATLLA